MNGKELFEKFDREGKFIVPGREILFDKVPWAKHSSFDGVELKHIVTGDMSEGKFSFHLVKIAPGKKIGSHIHEEQTETHEVIAGSGVCVNDSARIDYEVGVISVFPAGTVHEVIAGENGLYLFAKFFPPLC
ncbi:MAG: cupin domain-containing protein [Oscillospiraceae bacterium]|nr:cupin domain-containing protein [Oscillospiraceae bacterium]